MIPTPAQYLLRFDDLCPTVARSHWQRFLPLIAEFGLQPILAVIPDNQDEELKLSPPDAEFWAGMRALEAAGATIGLHGFHHLCVCRGRSLLPLHSRSEFAGVPEERQQRWIHSGLEILRGQSLHPTIFVAPRHGFDYATLRALRMEGIPLISDGFARLPFTRGGLTWIPQQLWSPVSKSKGLWTICVHSHSASDAQVDELQAFVRAHSAQFTSVDRVLAELSPGKLDLTERLHEAWSLWRLRASRSMKQRKLRFRRGNNG